MPKVSVILPIFNVEKYLPNALKSLKKQKLKDLEIICINNGSSDSSQKIVNEFQNNNQQVVSISHIAPKSIGAARNDGLSRATGEYIAFLDPDDTFNPDALYLLYEKATKQEPHIDTILYSYQKMDENYNPLNEEVRVAKHIGKPGEPFAWEKIKTKVFGIDGKFWAGWTKFVNTNFLRKNKIEFSDCSLCEDHIFTLKSLLNAKTLGYIDDPIYNYMVRQNSASRKKAPTDPNKVLDVFQEIQTLLESMKLQKKLKKGFQNYIETIKNFMLPKIEEQSKNKFETDCAKIITAWEKFCK